MLLKNLLYISSLILFTIHNYVVNIHSYYITQPVWTLFLFKSIWIRPHRSQGCQKTRFSFSQIKQLSFCANIAPKRHKLQKNIKIEKKCKKNPCFLRVFQIFFILGPILAHQTSNTVFSEPWTTSRHTRDPGARSI